MRHKGNSKNFELTKNILLRRKYGDIARVSEITGYSRDYVKKVLNDKDKRNNITIINVAIKLISKRESIKISKNY